MEKIYKGVAPLVVETDDIENIASFTCENLDVGDLVIKKDSGKEYNYIVSKKGASEMSFSYNDEQKVEIVKYKKTNGAWAYDKTETTELGGGDDPRIPSMTGQGGKFLKVNSEGTGGEYGNVSSLDLLGYAQVLNDDTDYLSVRFSNIDITKITQKTLLIFTYANCFVFGMLSQTGEGRVAGYLVYDSSGSAKNCGVKFLLVNDTTDYDIEVVSSIDRSLTDFSSRPTAYLFALTIQ